MAVRRSRARNRRKKGNRGPVVGMILVVIFLLAGAFYLASRMSTPMQGRSVEKAEIPAQKYKIPPRAPEQPVAMEDYSSAVLPPAEPARPKVPKVLHHGTVAIIVDDMGNSVHEADALLAVHVPITFSIIPGFAKVREVAQAAHRRGEEVMVHIPMEPKGYRQKPFEKNGLLVAMGDDEIQGRLEGFIDSIPFAAGANNHMGSRFTEERDKMIPVLTVLKKRGMFFVDSKTSPASVGDKVAREAGVPVASRNIFLDNEQDVGAIKAQIQKLVGVAKKSGSAIGICHPHKATIQALAETLPGLKAEGIKFVHASALVK